MDLMIFGAVTFVGGGVLGYFFGHNRKSQEIILAAERGFIKIEGELYNIEHVIPNISKVMKGSASSPSPSETTPPKS